MRARNAVALVLLLSLSCCATSGELTQVSDALWNVHNDLEALRKSSDPAAVAKATQSVEEAAKTVEVVGKTVAQRTGEMLTGAAKALTAGETGILSGLMTLAGMALTWILRDRTRGKALERVTGNAPPSA